MIANEERTENYVFVSVSDRGINHRLDNVPNQDAVMYEIKEEDFAIAVSDGVGSCPMADIGSKVAVESVRLTFLDLKNGILPLELERIVRTIINYWKELINNPRIDDFCATLKAAIKIGKILYLISIGDGLIIVTSGGMSMCSPIENTLFANQTNCLNETVSAEGFWTNSFVLDTYMPYVVFACTDGVANGIKTGQEMELVREIEEQISKESLKEELENFLISISEYGSDDRTVGVVKYERSNAKPFR